MLKRKNASGFSLIEMIMTLALLSLVFSIGCYGFNRVIPKYRLEGAVNSLVSDFHLARMRAIGQNCFYRIQVDSGQKQYFLERESLTGPSRWPGIRDGLLRKFNDPGNPFSYPGVEFGKQQQPSGFFTSRRGGRDHDCFKKFFRAKENYPFLSGKGESAGGLK